MKANIQKIGSTTRGTSGAKKIWPILAAASILAGLSWAILGHQSAEIRPGTQTAIVDGHRIAFRIAGSGRPALVMISGLGDGMQTFDGVVEEIAKTSTVIAYDRAGYGGSEAATGPRDAVAAERELSGLLENSGVSGPYVLLGHSLGGLFAEYYATKHPEQIAGLILEESRPSDFSRLCMGAGLWGCRPPAWATWFMAKGARDEVAALSSVEGQVAALTPAMNKPVLVLSRPENHTNSASFDSVWTFAQARLAARYPGSQHLSAEAGGHYLHQDQHKWFVDAVQEFLTEKQVLGLQ